jgi:hypothetical protein
MKVAATSDWRDGFAFDTPVIVADVLPGDPTRCSVCGGASAPLPRTELWAVKHRHPKHHSGHVRFYCGDHVPVVAVPVAAPVAPRRAAAPRERRPAVHRAPVVERQAAAVCPDCFIEIPPTGVCGMCGRPAD